MVVTLGYLLSVSVLTISRLYLNLIKLNESNLLTIMYLISTSSAIPHADLIFVGKFTLEITCVA
jgi:hypothetical protein